MPHRKRLIVAALLPLIFSLVDPTNLAATSSLAPNKTLISVVLLTPQEFPHSWGEGSQLSLVKEQVTLATDSWRSASGKLLDFQTRITISNPLPGLNHCATSTDWKVALTVLKLRTVKSSQKLLVFNPSDSCSYAGYAQVGGSFASIRTINSTTIAHELGHTFGFQHSASITCPDNEFLTLNAKCSINQYGDRTDVMGNGLAIPEARMSLAQQALVWRKPSAVKGKVGTYLLKASTPDAIGTLLSLTTSNGTAYIEFDDGSANGGYKISELDSPGIEIRIVGNSIVRPYRNSGESGISTLTLGKLVGFDRQGNCQSLCGTDMRFHEGETINIPGSTLKVEVIGVDLTSAKILIASR